MNKKKSVIPYILFFIWILLIEGYCLLRFRDNMEIIIGVGAFMLVAAYLMLDAIRNTYHLCKEENEKGKKEQYERLINCLEDHFKEMETIQKAIYIVSKNTTSAVEEGLDKTTKIIVKYHREDMNHLGDKNTKEMDTITDLLEKVMKQLEEKNNFVGSQNKSASDVAAITECINHNNEVMKIKVEGGFELVEGNLSDIHDTLVAVLAKLKGIDEKVNITGSALEAAVIKENSKIDHEIADLTASIEKGNKENK